MSEQQEKKSKLGGFFKIVAVTLILGDVSLLVIGLIKIFQGIAETDSFLSMNLAGTPQVTWQWLLRSR